MCESKWFKFIVRTWKGYIRLRCTFPNEGAYRGNKHSEQCKMIKILNKTRIVRIVSFQTSLRRSLDPRHYTSRPSFQMSDVESRISDVGCRISDVGCRMSDVRSRMSDVGCQISDVRSRMSDVGCGMSNLGCRMSDVESRMAPISFRTIMSSYCSKSANWNSFCSKLTQPFCHRFVQKLDRLLPKRQNVIHRISVKIRVKETN